MNEVIRYNNHNVRVYPCASMRGIPVFRVMIDGEYTNIAGSTRKVALRRAKGYLDALHSYEALLND